MGEGNILFALGLTILAGLSSGIGSAIAFFAKTANRKFLSLSLGFSAGVARIMVFISLDELLPAAKEFGEHHLSIYDLIGGTIVMAISLLLFV